MTAKQTAQVRRFNRLVTQRAGALDDHFLGRDRPLGESRVLFEIGPRGADLRDLRARLGLDSGYLSRLVQSLASKGLVKLRSGPDDERVRRAQLTPAGLAEMAEIHQLLQVSGARVERVDPASDAARWCVAQYFAELATRFEGGFDPRKSIPVDDAELMPPRGAFLVITIDGEPVACGAVKPIAPGVGYLKRMWVAGAVRGLGFGRHMLRALESQARELGLTTLRLETNRALVEAIRLYKRSGYVEVKPFNTEPYADHWFEKHLA